MCSMQPNSCMQHIPFRYFDANMVRKNLPLVVSFKRVNKLQTQPNDDNECDVVSICDIHRRKELNNKDSFKNNSTRTGSGSASSKNKKLSSSFVINFKPNDRLKTRRNKNENFEEREDSASFISKFNNNKKLDATLIDSDQNIHEIDNRRGPRKIFEFPEDIMSLKYESLHNDKKRISLRDKGQLSVPTDINMINGLNEKREEENKIKIKANDNLFPSKLTTTGVVERRTEESSAKSNEIYYDGDEKTLQHKMRCETSNLRRKSKSLTMSFTENSVRRKSN